MGAFLHFAVGFSAGNGEYHSTMRQKSSRAQTVAAVVHPDHDRLFKELITLLFIEFLELFAPHVAAQIDPDSIEFVDKEIFAPFLQSQEYEVDILVKCKIAGEQRFVIIHIENQAKKQGGFGGRMFDYFVVVRAKFGLRIYPIALLSYDKPKNVDSNLYTETEFGMEVVRYQFQTIQLNRLKWQDYIGNGNPVAVALMTKMNVASQDRATVRKEFYTLFTTGKLNNRQLGIIDEFMQSYLKLTKQELKQIEKETVPTMPTQAQPQYRTFLYDWEEEAFERGEHDGAVSLILRQAEKRLGTLSDALRQRITALPTDKVEEMGLALFDFETQTELTQWLDANS